MLRAGVVGLGDMGSGLAKNLIKNGFQTAGFDLNGARMAAFEKIGGKPAATVAEIGQVADAVYVMVMNGDQAKSVILGDSGPGSNVPGEPGLAAQMTAGKAIILSATVKPREAREIGAALEGSGIELIDSPVSGGFPGAQGGTLTMMAAAKTDVLDRFAPVMQAVSKTIHRVGTAAGDGQTVKACLQALIGGVFSATFEAAALAAKAGVKGSAFFDVVSTSSAGCTAANTALQNIIDRQFENTGSGIGTMHKDLTISMALAEELGVPMHTAAAAMQLFHAGKTKYPGGDNWIVTKVIEEIVGAELHR